MNNSSVIFASRLSAIVIAALLATAALARPASGQTTSALTSVPSTAASIAVMEPATAPAIAAASTSTSAPSTSLPGAAATAPATYVGSGGSPPPLPAAFGVLNSRSIFLKGRSRSVGSGTGSWRTGSTSGPTSPEQMLVFKGATRTEQAVAALVEDTSAGRVLTLRPGDAVASGAIVGITLTGIDYSVGGRVTHVGIGQNFLGVQVAPTSGPTTSLTTGGAAEDILEKMRRRRQQEVRQ